MVMSVVLRTDPGGPIVPVASAHGPENASCLAFQPLFPLTLRLKGLEQPQQPFQPLPIVPCPVHERFPTEFARLLASSLPRARPASSGQEACSVAILPPYRS